MLIGQIYFFLEMTIGTIKKITLYKNFFLDFEKSDAAVTIEITYKKFFWIFEKFDVGGPQEPKIFLSAALGMAYLKIYIFSCSLNKIAHHNVDAILFIFSYTSKTQKQRKTSLLIV